MTDARVLAVALTMMASCGCAALNPPTAPPQAHQTPFPLVASMWNVTSTPDTRYPVLAGGCTNFSFAIKTWAFAGSVTVTINVSTMDIYPAAAVKLDPESVVLESNSTASGIASICFNSNASGQDGQLLISVATAPTLEASASSIPIRVQS